jgi:hypothetical protein
VKISDGARHVLCLVVHRSCAAIGESEFKRFAEPLDQVQRAKAIDNVPLPRWIAFYALRRLSHPR